MNLSFARYGEAIQNVPKVRLSTQPYAGEASRSMESGVDAFSSSQSRSANLKATQSRMALPVTEISNSGVNSFANSSQQKNKPLPDEPDMVTQYRNLSSADLDRVKGLDSQELQANINRIKQYQPLANNEANRAMGMQLATQFPYKKYESESTSAREIMNNAQSAIPTFLNRATASRISPVTLSL